MAIFAIGMVKDEADVIAHTILHTLGEGVDRFLIADNNSTDGTRDLLNDLSKKHPEVTVLDDPDPAYFQSEKMSNLAKRAGSEGAEWIIPIDADELWFAPHSIANWLGDMSVNVVKAQLFNHFQTAVDQEGDTPFDRMVYRQAEPGVLPKVAFRYRKGAVIHQGNHGVDLSPDRLNPLDQASLGGLEIRHFPYRSVEQFIRKAQNGAAAYKATNMHPSEGAHWRQYGELLERGGEEALKQVYEQWFYFTVPALEGMVLDPAPFMRWAKG